MQGNHDACNDLPSSTDGWVVAGEEGRFYRVYFCVQVPKDLNFFSYNVSFPLFLGLDFGLGLGLGASIICTSSQLVIVQGHFGLWKQVATHLPMLDRLKQPMRFKLSFEIDSCKARCGNSKSLTSDCCNHVSCSVAILFYSPLLYFFCTIHFQFSSIFIASSSAC